MFAKDIINQDKEFIGKTFNRYDLLIKNGKNEILIDVNGKKYIDFISGIAVNALGYRNIKINKAIKKQINKYIHLSNLFYEKNQIILAKKICDVSFGSKVLFVNSGAEANEVAIKLARKWGILKKNKAFKIISFLNSFHGRTISTLTATGQDKFHKYLNPLSPGFIHAKFNDIEDFKRKIDVETVGVIIEPIQAEGGVHVANKKFLEEVKQICNEKEILLIFDEIQTGLGRTGYHFNYEYYNVEPDIMTLGKGLGGGIPLSAVVINNKLESILEISDHGTTMGGNPIACTAGNVFLDHLNRKFLDRIKFKEKMFRTELEKISSKNIKDIRGLGLLIGIELHKIPDNLISTALSKGLIINTTSDSVIRIAPPLIISNNSIKKGIAILKEIIEKS